MHSNAHDKPHLSSITPRILLFKTPSADVAVTHDSQWIDVFSEVRLRVLVVCAITLMGLR
ncbi:hypothetical protein HYDPIDRAFT_119901 [Hydnomerulius pinastri MD-312]|uniref:Uncharacterized protein n=1 Tax=Hydnomerulius pinastri MD-312 TaxID=994086 RepID=A0A0C9W666_9AGAM|nr:hypothetical protein HYDPIDRAFT_119901 [Hydnomerulius pinastri MD-312]